MYTRREYVIDFTVQHGVHSFSMSLTVNGRTKRERFSPVFIQFILQPVQCSLNVWIWMWFLSKFDNWMKNKNWKISDIHSGWMCEIVLLFGVWSKETEITKQHYQAQSEQAHTGQRVQNNFFFVGSSWMWFFFRNKKENRRKYCAIVLISEIDWENLQARRANSFHSFHQPQKRIRCFFLFATNFFFFSHLANPTTSSRETFKCTCLFFP